MRNRMTTNSNPVRANRENMKFRRLSPYLLIISGLACNTPSLKNAVSTDSSDSPAETFTPNAPPVVPTAQSVAPVGGLIVYTCFVDGSDEICLMDADGSEQRQLTSEVATDFYGALSPDGQTIVFSTRRDGQFEIYTMDLMGQNLTRLTENRGDNYAPSYSPDGSRIAYISTVTGDQNVWIMNADGSNPIQITDRPSEEYDPTWSPDGTRIAFASGYTGTNELYVINANGTNLVQVTANSEMREGGRNDWSPDGQWLAIYAGPIGEKNVYLIPSACIEIGPCGPSQYTRVTTGGNAKAPSFSPDGQWIAFAGGPTKNNDIFIIKRDGTGLQQLTNGTLSEWQPRWGR